MKNLTLIITLILHTHFFLAQDSNILLKTDFDGKVAEGSIEQLIEAIQGGEQIRLGWQLDFDQDKKSDLEHWVDAEFISILNGHVFNQVSPIYRQVPKKEIPQIEILPSPMKWTAIIGTNGKMLSRYVYPEISEFEDENIRKMLEKKQEVKTRMVATTWTKAQ